MRVSGILKPEYLLRPHRIFKRIRHHFWPSTQPLETTRLPIGACVKVQPGEVIGRLLLTHGTYDLPLAETLWRLSAPGETCVDVGANIGYMTVLMALRSAGGTVHAFEPHPGIFSVLKQNVEDLQNCTARIRLHPCAASDENFERKLFVPECIGSNAGLSTLEPRDGADRGERISVQTVRLDRELSSTTMIRLMKVDVEGHECSVFRGATGLLSRGVIRNIVFEDFHGYPGEVSSFLESHGFSIFEIRRGFFGPRLEKATTGTSTSRWEPPNYLATLDADEAIARMSPRGWHVI